MESHATDLQREMDAQRDAREQSEHELQGMREGHARMEKIVRELQGIALQLRGTLSPVRSPRWPLPQAPGGRPVKRRITAWRWPRRWPLPSSG